MENVKYLQMSHVQTSRDIFLIFVKVFIQLPCAKICNILPVSNQDMAPKSDLAKVTINGIIRSLDLKNMDLDTKIVIRVL